MTAEAVTIRAAAEPLEALRALCLDATNSRRLVTRREILEHVSVALAALARMEAEPGAAAELAEALREIANPPRWPMRGDASFRDWAAEIAAAALARWEAREQATPNASGVRA